MTSLAPECRMVMAPKKSSLIFVLLASAVMFLALSMAWPSDQSQLPLLIFVVCFVILLALLIVVRSLSAVSRNIQFAMMMIILGVLALALFPDEMLSELLRPANLIQLVVVMIISGFTNSLKNEPNKVYPFARKWFNKYD